MTANQKNELKEYLKKWAAKYVIQGGDATVYQQIVVFESEFTTIIGYIHNGKITGYADIEEGSIKYMKFKNKIMKFRI